MKRRAMGERRRRRLIGDIVGAQHDVLEIAARHHLSLEELSAWIAQPANRRLLNGLCVLADVQTQLLLSRYRLHAAGRLIGMATAKENKDTELSRRACVDLLRVELHRADAADGDDIAGDTGDGDGDSGTDAAGGAARPVTLREQMYGHLSRGASAERDAGEPDGPGEGA